MFGIRFRFLACWGCFAAESRHKAAPKAEESTGAAGQRYQAVICGCLQQSVEQGLKVETACQLLADSSPPSRTAIGLKPTNLKQPSQRFRLPTHNNQFPRYLSLPLSLISGRVTDLSRFKMKSFRHPPAPSATMRKVGVIVKLQTRKSPRGGGLKSECRRGFNRVQSIGRQKALIKPANNLTNEP